MPDRRPVTVLTQYHYCGPLLGDAIQSALGQANSNVKVAAFNDGAIDYSRDVMSLFGERIVGVE